MSSGFSLKDQLFNRERVKYLAGLFLEADPSFDSAGFVKKVMKGFQPLELKQRIVHITQALEKHLDSDFKIAAKQIVEALPPPLDPTKTDDDFGDFIFAPLGEFVVRNGLEAKHRNLALKTLRELTQRFSMEDAMRAFINTWPEETFERLSKWSTDKNYHVRRLVSESTRPFLPWSVRLNIDASKPMELLEKLHSDSTRYVTRSVANHLNDISKIDPDLVLKTLKKWKTEGQQSEDEMAWMTRHALRTLVKKGHAGALKTLGFRPNPKISIGKFALSPQKVKPGEAIEFSFEISADQKESLLVDYIIHFVKANGTSAPKVFKLKQLQLEKGEKILVKKRHPFRANATTFTLYPGTHHITLQINGMILDKLSFEMQQ